MKTRTAIAIALLLAASLNGCSGQEANQFQVTTVAAEQTHPSETPSPAATVPTVETEGSEAAEPTHPEPTETEPAAQAQLEPPAETIPPQTVTPPVQQVTAETVAAEPVMPEPPATEPEPTVPPHTHSYSVKSITSPTCTAPGSKVFACACGDSYEKEIPFGHSWEQSSTEEVGHWGAIVCVCRCGWQASSSDQSSAVAQFFTHVEQFGYTEERDNHSYDCVGENWIVDTPASTVWVCSRCGAVSAIQP